MLVQELHDVIHKFAPIKLEEMDEVKLVLQILKSFWRI